MHNLEMAELVRSSVEYNRRATIIEGLRAGRSPTKIIRFFKYPISTVYDIQQKYAEMSEKGSANPMRKIYSKGKMARTSAVIQRVHEFISENLGTSLRKLATILRVGNATMCRIAEIHVLCDQSTDVV